MLIQEKRKDITIQETQKDSILEASCSYSLNSIQFFAVARLLFLERAIYKSIFFNCQCCFIWKLLKTSKFVMTLCSFWCRTPSWMLLLVPMRHMKMPFLGTRYYLYRSPVHVALMFITFKCSEVVYKLNFGILHVPCPLGSSTPVRTGMGIEVMHSSPIGLLSNEKVRQTAYVNSLV